MHPHQGSLFSGDDWQRSCRDHNLDPSMSRKGNGRDKVDVSRKLRQRMPMRGVKKTVQTTRRGQDGMSRDSDALGELQELATVSGLTMHQAASTKTR